MALPYDAVLQTVFVPFETGALDTSKAGAKVLFINAQYSPMLQHFDQAGLTCQQYFKPYAAVLEVQGVQVQPDLPEEALNASFDLVLILAPKSQVETWTLMARGVQFLKSGGALVVAAANKAGGNRLANILSGFGLDDVHNESRNKARVVWARTDTVDERGVEAAIAAGQPQSVLGGAYQSWPGIYGWDKIDQGSALLAQHLPENLQGKGADFGCGYGFLARYVVEHCAVHSMICVDADWRALEMCRQNLQGYGGACNLNFLWVDCTKPVCEGLDFIVMNPPFHEGKVTNSEIGQAFIRIAAISLKPGGRLWMVANKQLPYETVLEQVFAKVEKLYEGQGFKVFCAQK
ncbi:MAG: class I SAM-dependent methyltransferase [Rhodospirillales bacterium]|nr:class I SAM-dependent methyltransferase [Rhodospirillales bacterium]